MEKNPSPRTTHAPRIDEKLGKAGLLKNIAFILFTLNILTACGAGLTGSQAVDAPGSAGNSLDADTVGEAAGGAEAPAPPIPAAAAGAPDALAGGNAAYYYLPGYQGPRMAAAPGGSGVLSAPADDDQMGANCGRDFSLADDKHPETPLDPIYEHYWSLPEGKGLQRKLRVSRKTELPPEDIQVRIYYEQVQAGSVRYRDFLLPKLDAQSQAIEIAAEAPEFGDTVKVFYRPPKTDLDPQSKLYRSCALHRFEDFQADWTAASYADYAQGPKDRIYVNQIGHFVIRVRPALFPESGLKSILEK